MSSSETADCRLPIELLQPWLGLLKAAKSDEDRQAATQHYFDVVLPEVVKKLTPQRKHKRLRDEKCHTLVSLMGFSPETTVICATVVRPEKLVIVYGSTDDVKEQRRGADSYNRAFRFLVDNHILEPDQIHHQTIDPLDPSDIYEVIRQELEQTPTINDHTSALVDVTGGKKVMSATAGQAAWEMRVPLCYVEGEYEPLMRRPWPGTEQVIKLQNPSLQEQFQMRIDALQLYSDHNYAKAVEAFENCRANRTENRLDELVAPLCRCYVRLSDLDLPGLQKDVKIVESRLNENRIVRLFRDQDQSKEPWLDRLEILSSVADAEPLAMIATFQTLAELYGSAAFQRYDFACLLVYRAMEATMEYQLRQTATGKFELKAPDWSKLGDEAELKQKYIDLSREFDGKNPEKDLPPRITLVSGLAILCLVADIHESAGMQAKAFLWKMMELAKMRNESVLAHGTKTLTRQDFEKMHQTAESLFQWILQETCEQVNEIREGLKPIDILPLHDPTTF